MKFNLVDRGFSLLVAIVLVTAGTLLLVLGFLPMMIAWQAFPITIVVSGAGLVVIWFAVELPGRVAVTGDL